MNYLVTAVSGFASGVFLRSLFFFEWGPIVFIFFIAALFGAAMFLKPRLAYTLGAVFCMCVALGMLRMSFTETLLPDVFAKELRHRVTYSGIVVSDPDVRDANQRVTIKVTQGEASALMLAIAPRDPKVSVGDTVRVSGTLSLPQDFTENGRTFHYEKYLEKDGIRFLLNFAYLHVTEEASWYSVPAFFARIKHTFLNGLSVTLPEPYASLAGGIVIGGKSGLGTELKEEFIRSGLIQIIVLSGYNIMIVATWVMSLLAYTTLSRRWSMVAGAVAILLFVCIAGLSATALRAALMALIALYARATARTYTAGRALVFVVLLMLIWNPLYLVYDPGFGLSVVATAGLIWLAPRIETFLQFLKNEFWRGAVATTLAAQTAVLPLLLYNTGTLSLVALPANLLALPAVPIAMGFSALASIAGTVLHEILPAVGTLLALPAYIANAYLLYIAQTSAALPFAAFTLPPFSFWLVVVLYAGLIYITASKRFSTTPQLRLAKNASI